MSGLAGWLAAAFTAALFGSRYVPGMWYETLSKPAWTPPNWIFGPVWTLIYITMAVAAWLVWLKVGFAGGKMALGLFVFHLFLNAAWSYLFFGLHRPDLALIDIFALWFTILATGLLFYRIRAVSGLLMLPYLAWVSFAAWLNFALWRLNSGQMLIGLGHRA